MPSNDHVSRPVFAGHAERAALGVLESRIYSVTRAGHGWTAEVTTPRSVTAMPFDDLERLALSILLDSLGDAKAGQRLSRPFADVLADEGADWPGVEVELGQSDVLQWARRRPETRMAMKGLWGTRYVARRLPGFGAALAVEYHTGHQEILNDGARLSWGDDSAASRDLAATVLAEIQEVDRRYIENHALFAVEEFCAKVIAQYPLDSEWIELSKVHVVDWLLDNAPELTVQNRRGLEL